MNQADLLPFFHELADIADEITAQYFRNTLNVHSKGTAFDPVTQADQETESAIRALIMRKYPDHGIIGEEFGTINENADYIWVLDPIDGTRAFIGGIPTWGTLIGLLHMGKPFMGMASQGFIGERWWGDGATAFFSHKKASAKRMQTRNTTHISDAILATTSPDLFNTTVDLTAFNTAKALAKSTRYGGDFYNYISLCMGNTDAVIESGLKPYDILPLIPILEGAGAIVSGWNNEKNSSNKKSDGQVLASATARLHTQLQLALSSK